MYDMFATSQEGTNVGIHAHVHFEFIPIPSAAHALVLCALHRASLHGAVST